MLIVTPQPSKRAARPAPAPPPRPSRCPELPVELWAVVHGFAASSARAALARSSKAQAEALERALHAAGLDAGLARVGRALVLGRNAHVRIRAPKPTPEGVVDLRAASASVRALAGLHPAVRSPADVLVLCCDAATAAAGVAPLAQDALPSFAFVVHDAGAVPIAHFRSPASASAFAEASLRAGAASASRSEATSLSVPVLGSKHAPLCDALAAARLVVLLNPHGLARSELWLLLSAFRSCRGDNNRPPPALLCVDALDVPEACRVRPVGACAARVARVLHRSFADLGRMGRFACATIDCRNDQEPVAPARRNEAPVDELDVAVLAEDDSTSHNAPFGGRPLPRTPAPPRLPDVVQLRRGAEVLLLRAVKDDEGRVAPPGTPARVARISGAAGALRATTAQLRVSAKLPGLQVELRVRGDALVPPVAGERTLLLGPVLDRPPSRVVGGNPAWRHDAAREGRAEAGRRQLPLQRRELARGTGVLVQAVWSPF